jgi:hypothetical protein
VPSQAILVAGIQQIHCMTKGSIINSLMSRKAQIRLRPLIDLCFESGPTCEPVLASNSQLSI